MLTKICNKCGKRMDYWDHLSNISICKDLSYGSKYDGCHLRLDLCNECLDELIDSCKIIPFFDMEVS